MEIQKIFSNIEDPEETLYSVLMSEDEIDLFSEIQKEFASIKDLKKAANISAKVYVQGGITKGQARSLNSALRNVWESAAGQKAGIPKYVSKGYKTIANPEFKRKARKVAKESVNKEVSPAMKQLNKQGLMKHPDYSKVGKRKAAGTIYDHGFPSARYRDSDNTLGFMVKR